MAAAGCRAPQQQGAQQHGVQQQMRAVSRCQLTQEAEHRFVYLGFEVGVGLLRSEFALGVRVCGSVRFRIRSGTDVRGGGKLLTFVVIRR